MKTENSTAERQEFAQALGESEQRYRRLLAATTDYIYSVTVVNGQAGTTSHGPGCAAVTGYTSAEYSADPYLWYRIIHEEDRALVLAQAERILAGDTPPPLEHRVLHKRGGVRWIRNTTIPHRDSQGRLMSYDGLISDITERKRAELFVATEHAVLAGLASAPTLDAALPVVLQSIGSNLSWYLASCWTMDAESGNLNCKAVWHRPGPAFSAGTQTVQARTPALLRDKVIRDGEAVWVPDAAAYQAGEWCFAEDVELHGGALVPLRDGQRLVGVLEVWSPEVLPRDEEMLRVLATIASQIGQFFGRKMAEQRRDEEHRLLRTVVENLPDCIFVKDDQGRFVMNNSAHLRLLGVAEGQNVSGMTDFDFFPKELAMRFRDDDNGVCQSSQALLNREEQVLDRSGRQYWFLTTKVPLKNTEGRSVGLVGIGRDITERKRVAERLAVVYAKLARRGDMLKKMVRELKSSQRQLEATQMQLIRAAKLEAVGTLAAGVAHEVKNPLQIVLLGLRYLSQSLKGVDENTAQTISDMREAVNRADAIIRDLLTLAAVSEFHLDPGNLNWVIEGALRLMRNQFVAAKVKVNCRLCAHLPEIPMDVGKLQQIFLNFFQNSIQAMPDGGILSVSTWTARKNGQAREYAPLLARFRTGDSFVVAEVQDTGTGIADADLPRIFDPFFTTKPVGVGTGLGLTMAQKIIELHGGAVTIGNTPPPGGVRVAVAFKA